LVPRHSRFDLPQIQPLLLTAPAESRERSRGRIQTPMASFNSRNTGQDVEQVGIRLRRERMAAHVDKDQADWQDCGGDDSELQQLTRAIY
jgi:hypothetical protein